MRDENIEIPENSVEEMKKLQSKGKWLISLVEEEACLHSHEAHSDEFLL